MRSRHRLRGGSYWDGEEGARSNAKTRRSSRYGGRAKAYDEPVNMDDDTDLPF